METNGLSFRQVLELGMQDNVNGNTCTKYRNRLRKASTQNENESLALEIAQNWTNEELIMFKKV